MDQIDAPAQKSADIKAKPAPALTIILWVASLFCALPLATGDTSVQSIVFFMIALVLSPPSEKSRRQKLSVAGSNSWSRVFPRFREVQLISALSRM